MGVSGSKDKPRPPAGAADAVEPVAKRSAPVTGPTGVTGSTGVTGQDKVKDAGSAVQPSLAAAWDNHFSAFAAKDLRKILADYTESSVVKVYTQETGELKTYTGLAGVKELFTGLFAKLEKAVDCKPACDPVVESVFNIAPCGHVFLQWSAPSAGIDYASDTFIFDAETHKILRQDVVLHDMKAPVGAPADSVITAEGTKAQDAWDNHFAAFGDKNLEQIMKDYEASASQINMYVQGSGKINRIRSSAIRMLFKKLFHNLKDRSELKAPLIHCEVLPSGLGHVFLIWRSPTDGYKYVSDTFILGQNGCIIRQNIVALKTSDDVSPAPSPKADGK